MNDDKNLSNENKEKENKEIGIKKHAIAFISALSGHTVFSKTTRLTNCIQSEDIQIALQEDNTDKNGNDKIEQMLVELGECREDERSSENTLIQILVFASATLGVVFTVSGNDIFKNKTLALLLFLLGVFIFIAVFSYINTLGIASVLRFHYIRYIEDSLAKLIPYSNEENFIHWKSFSSPVMTRDITHLNSKYSVMYFMNYIASILFIIMFSCLIIILLYLNLDLHFSLFWIILIIILMFFSFAIFFVFTLRAKIIFMDTKRISIEKREVRLSKKSIIKKTELMPAINDISTKKLKYKAIRNK